MTVGQSVGWPVAWLCGDPRTELSEFAVRCGEPHEPTPAPVDRDAQPVVALRGPSEC